MVLTTDTYWSIDGVPLNTLAYNVSTWGGDLQSPPSLRGEDLTIPYRPGQVFQARRPEGRSMTFSMWVVGADVDGNIPASKTMRAEFEKNFKMLRNLFWKQGKQVTITKRWKDYTTGTVQTAEAQGVYAGGIAPSMNGSLRASFTVELYLSDPFFYGPEVTVNFAATATSNQTITVPGDYETSVAVMDFNGTRNNFRLTNTTEAVYVNVNQSITSGQLVRVDIDNFTARKNPSTTNENVIGSTSSFGHPFWFILRPGSQSLSLTSGSGTGSGVLKYRPRWL